MKEKLALDRPVRSVTRSDGCVKIYGWTTDGQFVTVMMEKASYPHGYEIRELKIGGVYRIFDFKVL